MNSNAKLHSLYESKFKELTPLLNDYNDNVVLSKKDPFLRATNPLMLKVKEDWDNSNIKIMIFGQENNYWAGECGNEGAFCGKIDEVIDIYDDFYLKNKMYASPFWNEFRKIRNDASIEGKTISYAWNNIVKIGRLGLGCIPEIHEITKVAFNVVEEELKILKPDIIIFFTGPNYDARIRDVLGDYTKIEIPGFNSRQMCEFEFKEKYSVKKAIRTYHPKYLYYNKDRKNKHIGHLISEIKTCSL